MFNVGDIVWVDWGHKCIQHLKGGYIGPARITQVADRERWVYPLNNPVYFIKLPISKQEFIAYHKSLEKIGE